MARGRDGRADARHRYRCRLARRCPREQRITPRDAHPVSSVECWGSIDPLKVVVDNLHALRPRLGPTKGGAVLLIDANGVFPAPIAPEGLQATAGRRARTVLTPVSTLLRMSSARLLALPGYLQTGSPAVDPSMLTDNPSARQQVARSPDRLPGGVTTPGLQRWISVGGSLSTYGDPPGRTLLHPPGLIVSSAGGRHHSSSGMHLLVTAARAS